MRRLAHRPAALSRHQAPQFVMLGGLELMALRKLGWLARALFLELCAMADFATGRGETSYAVLESLLDFDPAPQAHTPDRPTQKRIRTALEALIAVGLVSVDRIKNEKTKGLFFRIASRHSISAPDDMKGRLSGRPEKEKKLSRTTTCERSKGDEGQTERQGVQENSLSPLPPKLSTSPAPHASHAAAAGPMSVATVLDPAPPRGGGQDAPPPGPSRWVLAMREMVKKQSPQGGTTRRPPGPSATDALETCGRVALAFEEGRAATARALPATAGACAGPG